MILKIKQESSISQPDEQERFTAYLIDKLNPKDSKLFDKIIASFTEKELNELYKQFKTMDGTLFAKMGAKMNYLTRLNGKCPEGYEIEKFAAGGCAKCKKKAKALMFDLGGSPKRIQNDSTAVKADAFENRRQEALHAEDTIKEIRQKVMDANRQKLRDLTNERVKQTWLNTPLRKCGGKAKKRISKKENGSAFKPVNGGPGSVDSTRDMKPNRKLKKMIKKHKSGGVLPLVFNPNKKRFGLTQFGL